MKRSDPIGFILNLVSFSFGLVSTNLINMQEEDFSQRFKEGDFLQHINPYKGEHEKLVVAVDTKKKQYKCAWMKGKHSPKPDFDNHELFDFDVANRCLVKVG